MEEFSKLEETRRHCYSLCSHQKSKVTPPWAELAFFQFVLERSHCVRRCTEKGARLQLRWGVVYPITRALKTGEALSFIQSAYNEVMHSFCEPVRVKRL